MTMRCVDVIEKLAVLTGPPSAELAEHMARCPHCAAWAERDARLGQYWEATRPEEPGAAVWASVWAKVTQALEGTPVAPLTLAVSSPRPDLSAVARPWQRWAWASFGIAQAAVLLVGAWLVTRPDVVRPPQPHEARPDFTLALLREPVEIPYGTTVMIDANGPELKVVSRPTDEGSSAVDPNFLMFGAVEAMAE
jgi:hypothetical protein